MQSRIESIKRLLNSKHKVSCHYLIGQNGKILRLVKEKNIAWHAGKSNWKNYTNLNQKLSELQSGNYLMKVTSIGDKRPNKYYSKFYTSNIMNE